MWQEHLFTIARGSEFQPVFEPASTIISANLQGQLRTFIRNEQLASEFLLCRGCSTLCSILRDAGEP
jgi:hypothetical protein